MADYHIEMINGFPVIVYDDGSYSNTSVTPMIVNENNIKKSSDYMYIPITAYKKEQSNG